MAGSAIRTVFDLAAPAALPEGWRIEDDTGTLELRPGRLCVASSPVSPGTVFHLSPDSDAYLFLWLELDGRAEAGVTLYWDNGADFSENQTVSAVFGGPFEQHPYRLSYLLPQGVRAFRLHVRPTAGLEVVCLRQLWIERVGATAPSDRVQAGSR